MTLREFILNESAIKNAEVEKAIARIKDASDGDAIRDVFDKLLDRGMKKCGCKKKIDFITNPKFINKWEKEDVMPVVNMLVKKHGAVIKSLYDDWYDTYLGWSKRR